MNDRMRTGMAEASRLTRAGRLAEATAVIQRTLRAVPAPEGLSTTTDLESIDAVFRVVDAIPLPTEVSAQRPAHHLSISETATLPPSDVAMSPPQNGGASAELIDTRPDLREDQHSGRPSTILHTREITRADSTHRRGLRDLLASARHFALPGVASAGQHPYPYWTGHGARFSQGVGLSRDPAPTRLEPAATSYTSPVDIAGKPCLWSSCCMAVRRPLTISPPAPG